MTLNFLLRPVIYLAGRVPPARKVFMHRWFAMPPLPEEVAAFHYECPDVSEFIKSVSDGKVTINIISNRPWLAKRVRKGLSDVPVNIVDGRGFPSFSALCNSVLKASPGTTHIIIGDKCFPRVHDLAQINLRLSQGYGLVGAYRFGCFAIHPCTLSVVGFFDELFLGGGHEDSDFVYRCLEKDIAVFTAEAIRYFPLPSSWKSLEARKRFDTKWDHATPGIRTRLLPDDTSANPLRSTNPDWKLRKAVASRFANNNAP